MNGKKTSSRRIISRHGKDIPGQAKLFKDSFVIRPPTVIATLEDVKFSIKKANHDGTFLICRVAGKRDKRTIIGIDDRGRVVVALFQKVRGGVLIDTDTECVDASAILWMEGRRLPGFREQSGLSDRQKPTGRVSVG